MHELEPGGRPGSAAPVPEAAPDHAPRWLWRAQIGRRLLVWILVASSLVTLLLTSLQLYLDYRRDVDGIEARLAEIEHGYLPSLAGSLWKLDREQLQLQIEGITRLPDILGAEVQGAQGPLTVQSGRIESQAVYLRTMPISYEDRGERRLLGELRVAATLEGVYQRLTERALIILASQGIKTFLVSFFILFIVHQVVTRHLGGLARYFADFDIRAPAGPPKLARTPREVPDELDHLVHAFASLQTRLERAYADLSIANRDLQTDIAARREAEAEINRLNLELEQRVEERTAELESANRELAAFTYSVSHDLRAPLRAVHGFSHLLDRELEQGLSAQGKHYLERIRNGVERMGSLIDDLLRLSQISQRAMNPARVDLSALGALVAQELQASDPVRQVTWSIAPGMQAWGDQGLLRIVLENLLGNAWKYTGKRDHARIEMVCDATGERPAFCIRDNGVGFDMQYGERLFEAFQRLHHVEEFPGTGIGLATVARIIHRHGGSIWATALVGEGASFFFTLGERDRSGNAE
jgi:signal transduction histidine kinase